MSEIKNLQESIHAWAVRKEWRGPNSSQRPLVADLCLWTSEISEALEELRKNPDPLHYYESYTVEYLNPRWKNSTLRPLKFANLTWHQVIALTGYNPDELELRGKPEGFGPEAADLAIRLFETCEEYGVDLSAEITRKMDYNEGRELKHGGLLM